MATQRNSTLYRDVEVPADLTGAILHRIARARRRAASLRLAALGVGLFASCAALVPAFVYLESEWIASGFGEYLTLVWSDGFAHWQSLSYSLFEALPSAALLVLFVVLAASYFSLRSFVRTARITLPLFA